MRPTETGRVDWSTGVPVDPVSGDVWFDRADPVGEAQHVFVHGNDLPARWRRGEARVLGEIGLGAGRTVVVAGRAFLDTAPSGATLDVVTIERAPLLIADAARVLAHVGLERDPLARDLLAGWPVAASGIQRVDLGGGRIRVHVVVDDAEPALAELAATVDAWCLDGFSPARDASAWTASVARSMAARSSVGATVATWSAAGHVRRAWREAGWVVDVVPGHAGKREMMVARWGGDAAAVAAAAGAAASGAPEAPTPPSTGTSPQPPRPRRVIVVGGGFAGAAVSEALACRGVDVTTFDAGRGGSPAASATELVPAASDVPRAIAEPVWGMRDGASRRLRWTGWSLVSGRGPGAGDRPGAVHVTSGAEAAVLRAARRRQRQASGASAMTTDAGAGGANDTAAGGSSDAIDPEGALDAWCADLHPSIVRRLDAAAASDHLGLRVDRGGVLVPGAFTVSGADWVAAAHRRAADAATAAGIDVRSDAVHEVRVEDGQWTATGSAGRPLHRADAIVFATGASFGLDVLAGLPRRIVRGQLERLAATPETARLRAIASGPASCLPAVDGIHVLAATHAEDDLDLAPRDADHAQLLGTLADGFPALAAALRPTSRGTPWVGRRITSPDRLPLVGPVPGPAPGIYVSLAHAGRGLVQSAVAGEILAGMLTGTPIPARRSDLAAWDPSRFRAARAHGSSNGRGSSGGTTRQR